MLEPKAKLKGADLSDVIGTLHFVSAIIAALAPLQFVRSSVYVI